MLLLFTANIILLFLHSTQCRHQSAWRKGPNGLVYLLNNNKLAWSDAKQYCEKRSGKLMIIESGVIRDAVKNLLKKEDDVYFWTGLTEDLFKKWSWDDGVGQSGFTDWAVGQPYEEEGAPGCGIVDNQGKWRVSHCETERRSLCQKIDNGIDDDETEVTPTERKLAESAKRKSHVPTQGARAKRHIKSIKTIQSTERSTKPKVEKSSNVLTKLGVSKPESTKLTNIKPETKIVTKKQKAESKLLTHAHSSLDKKKENNKDFKLSFDERLRENDLLLLRQNLEDFTHGNMKSVYRAKPLRKLAPLSQKSATTGQRRTTKSPRTRVYGGTSKMLSDGSHYCVFPFVYESQIRNICIQDESKSWCALSSNYDRDGLWGYCKDVDKHDKPDKTASGKRSNDTSSKASKRTGTKEMKEIIGTLLDAEGLSHTEKKKVMVGMERDPAAASTASFEPSTTKSSTTVDPLFYEVTGSLEDEEEKLLSQDFGSKTHEVETATSRSLKDKEDKILGSFTNDKIKAIFKDKQLEDERKSEDEIHKYLMHSDGTIQKLLTKYTKSVKKHNREKGMGDETVNRINDEVDADQYIEQDNKIRSDEGEESQNSQKVNHAEKVVSYNIMDDSTDGEEEEEDIVMSEEAALKKTKDGTSPNTKISNSSLLSNSGTLQLYKLTKDIESSKEESSTGNTTTSSLNFSGDNDDAGEDHKLKHHVDTKLNSNKSAYNAAIGTVFNDTVQGMSKQNQTEDSNEDIALNNKASLKHTRTDEPKSMESKDQPTVKSTDSVHPDKNKDQKTPELLQDYYQKYAKSTRAGGEVKTKVFLYDYFKKYATPSDSRTTKILANPYSEKEIETDKGELCVFPFVYKGESYFDCIKDDEPSGRYWCSTSDTHNYDRNPKKGFCKLIRKKVRVDRPTIRSRIGKSLLSSVDVDEKAKIEIMKTALSNSPHVPKHSIKTVSGKNCVFPFVYKGESYFDCTSEDDTGGRLWCSTSHTHNFDQNQSKDFCVTNPRHKIAVDNTGKRVADDEEEVALNLQAQALKDPSLLAKLKSQGAMDPSSDALKDPTLLAKLKLQGAMDPSSDALKDPMLLAKLKSQGAMDPSSDALKDPTLLAKLKSQGAMDPSSDALRDPTLLAKLKAQGPLDLSSNDLKDPAILERLKAQGTLDTSSNEALKDPTLLAKLKAQGTLDPSSSDEELNNGIVTEAMQQKLTDGMKAKLNQQPLDPNDPTNTALQSPTNQLNPLTSKPASLETAINPVLSKPEYYKDQRLDLMNQNGPLTQEQQLKQQRINQLINTNPHTMKIIMTENGEQCVFPFVYNSKTYFDCTNDDDISGKKWCSISQTHNYDKDPQKGYCVDGEITPGLDAGVAGAMVGVNSPSTTVSPLIAATSGQGTGVSSLTGSVATPLGSHLPFTTQQQQQQDPKDPGSIPRGVMKTTTGDPCVFPFVYNSVKYYDCINLDEPTSKYWCSTTTTQNFDQQPLKGICIDERNNNLFLDADKYSTGENQDQERLKEALDPFNKLTDPLRPKTEAETKLQQLISQEKQQQQQQQQQQPVGGQQNPTLQAPNLLNGNPHERKQIMTDAGTPCVFPFIHSGKTYIDCTSDDEPSGKFWCSLTSNFDRDQRKGICVDPRNADTNLLQMQLTRDLALQKLKAQNPLNEKIPSEKIPNLNQPLTRKDYLHLAGEELTSPDSGLKTYGGNSRNKSRCAIPFIYNRKSYYKCLPFVGLRNKNEMWCATTHNYDREMKWAKCCTSEKCGKDWAD